MEWNHFARLPEPIDYNEISDGIRKCISILRRNKIGLEKLIGMVEEASGGQVILNENTLKAWVRRKDTTRVQRSDTLEALFNYFVGNWYKFDPSIKSEMAGIWENFIPDMQTNDESKKAFKLTMEHIFGGLLLNWVGGGPDQVERYKRELCDEYYCIRRSVRQHNIIVSSTVKIEWIGPKDLMVTHKHYDRHEELRTSRGFMIPTDTNHIAILNVENGVSIEFLAVKKPHSEAYKRLIGFIVSINSNGALVCSRVALIRKSEVDADLPIRFPIDNYRRNKVVMKTISFLEDDRAMTIPDKTVEFYKAMILGDKEQGSS